MAPPHKISGRSATVPKSRRSSMAIVAKRLRTTLFTLRFSSRHPLIFSLLLLLLLLLLSIALFLFSHPSHPLSLSLRFPPLHLPLHHSQLYVPHTHFHAPSYFAADSCIKQFDQSWTLLHSPSPSPAPDRVRIVFAIQASGDTLSLLPRLLSRIHHPHNLYVIHIDAKVDSKSRHKFASFVSTHPIYSLNVHILPSEMLTYKGISTVVNSLALMTLALDLSPHWDYYINISASDYPLISPHNLALLLARPRIPSGLLNFVWFFPRSEWRPYSFRVRGMYWDPAASGVQSRKSRLHFMSHQKQNPLEKHRAYVFTKAEAWTILSRPFIQFLVRSSFAKRMLLSHAHILSVSEHLITDILFNHPFWRTTIVPDAFRQVVWYFRNRRSGQHPYTLDRGPSTYSFWPYLNQTPNIFARKFSSPDSPLMDRIDTEISGVGFNASDSRFVKFTTQRRRFFQQIVDKFDDLTKKTLRQQHFVWPSSAYPPLS